MTYKESIKKVDAKIWKWNYAIPLGIVAMIISNVIIPDTIIGDAIGIFNLLVLIGIVTGLADIVKYLRKK